MAYNGGMPAESVYLSAKQIEADIARLFAAIDLQALDTNARDVAKNLKRNASDARLDVRDYDFAETRAEQAQLGKEARVRLEAVHQGILDASQYNMISAVDVAELTARIDYLLERLV